MAPARFRDECHFATNKKTFRKIPLFHRKEYKKVLWESEGKKARKGEKGKGKISWVGDLIVVGDRRRRRRRRK